MKYSVLQLKDGCRIYTYEKCYVFNVRYDWRRYGCAYDYFIETHKHSIEFLLPFKREADDDDTL